MAKRKEKSAKRNQKGAHPGSSVEDAKAVGGKGDFGVPESDVVERTYASVNTKQSDPGNAQPRSGEDDSRTSGVGGHDSGPGSSSGGDLDTDIIGVGTSGGVAASGKIHEPPGPDDATGTSRDFASGPPAQGKNQSQVREVVHGSTIQPPDDATIAAGADSASRSERDDDSFVAEVSSDEASGRNDAGG